MTTKINPSEISSIVKKKIDGYKGAATEANVGEFLSTADGIVQIYGIEDAMYGERLDVGEGT
jgi:F-type H+-transporting ATPase subunit alpha